MAGSGPQHRAGDGVELGRVPGFDVAVERAVELRVGVVELPHRHVRIHVGAVRPRHGGSLLDTCSELRPQLGIAPDRPERQVERAGGARDRVQPHELAPHHLRSRVHRPDRHPGSAQRGGEALHRGRGRRDVDPEEAAGLLDPAGAHARRLDPDARGHRAVAVALAQQLEVLESVQERHHQLRLASDALEPSDEAGRLRGDDHRHPGRVELAYGAGTRLELAEPRARHVESVALDRGRRLLVRDDGHRGAGALERGRQEPPDSAGPEYCDPGH